MKSIGGISLAPLILASSNLLPELLKLIRLVTNDDSIFLEFAIAFSSIPSSKIILFLEFSMSRWLWIVINIVVFIISILAILYSLLADESY
ncbi:hypothetical protein RJG79_00630 [Mycoplasmatota bacterium WC44]